MSFEPAKFFIGLVDFFSILMPGTMLTYLGACWAATQLGASPLLPIESEESGFVFLFLSYLLGHLVFLAGSLLDEYCYDLVRNLTDNGQIRRCLVNNKPLRAHWKRRFAKSHFLFGRNADAAVSQVAKIKARALYALDADAAINAYQWSKAVLAKQMPDGLLAVQRLEADSKFFRSFVVALFILAALYASQHRWSVAAVCVAAIVPSLWRYIDQRFKGTQQAYWYLIALEALKQEQLAECPRADGLTHAGGVLCREVEGQLQVLLVRPSAASDEWVLPKGHIEPGEDPKEAAVREIQEETGYWGRILARINDVHLGETLDAPYARMYVFAEQEQCEKRPRDERDQRWLPVEDAVKEATHRESKELIARTPDLWSKNGR